ncbi:MAG: hypothetical protein ACI4XE_00720 [Acutalibacteraceae bacterium]
MKRAIRIISAVFLALSLVAGFFAATVSVRARTLGKNIDTENIGVFVPEGMANRFADPMAFSFDDFRMWEYRLNDREVERIEDDLQNGVWQKPTKEELDDVLSEFFLGGLPEKPEFSDEVYFCLPDNPQSKGTRLLFIYDASERTYLCVSMSI